jgi:plastocyanin
MRKTLLAIGLFAAATPAFAAPPAPPPAPTVVTVDMADRGFHPDVIRLKAGMTYRLRFINHDGTTHDFFAPRLLNSARITREEGWKLHGGRLNVPPHGQASLVLTPMEPAPYDAKSTKAIDVVSNMTAQVLVY